MFCPKCGAENKDTAKFCKNCGQPLGVRAAPMRGKQSWLALLGVVVVAVLGLVAGAVIYPHLKGKLSPLPGTLAPTPSPTPTPRARATATPKLQPTRTPIPTPTPTLTPTPSPPIVVAADAWNVEFVGHIGGTIHDVVVQDRYAYIGEGPRLTILDISSPTSPIVAGRSPLFPGVVQAVYVAGDHAYIVVEGAGLWVMDISDPSSPSAVGYYEAMWTTEVVDVVVTGDYAYVVTMTDLEVIDVSAPSQPKKVGKISMGRGWERNVSGIAVAEGYVYVAAEKAGLWVVDVSTPSHPREVGVYEVGEWEYARDVAVVGDYAFVAAEMAGLLVIDISTPSSPRRVASYETAGAALDVAVAGNYAYVPVLYGGQLMEAHLTAVDISVPPNPRGVGYSDSFAMATSVQRVAVDGDYACVAAERIGLVVFDVSMPSNRKRVGLYETSGETADVVVAGDYAYVAERHGYDAMSTGGLRVVDVSTPPCPKDMGFRETLGGANGVAVVGDHAYVATARGLRVVDVSTPSNVHEVGSCYTAGDAKDVAVSGNYAYVAAGEKGLRVIDISTPSAPKETGSCELEGAGSLPGETYGVAIAEDYAYVAGSMGLWVVDVSAPSNPREVSHQEGPPAMGVAVVEGYAYVASDPTSLTVVNVSTPLHLKEMSHWSWGVAEGGQPAFSIEVLGDYVYIASGDSLRVVDVSTPSNPKEAGFFKIPGWSKDVTVAGNYVYIAAGDGGLFILRFVGARIPTPAQTPQPITMPSCPAVSGPFARVWQSVKGKIDCATSNAITGLVAEENFEGGKMFWREPIDYAQALVLFNDGTWRIYRHAPFIEGSPEFSCVDADTLAQCPPTPKRGFGMIWCDIGEVRRRLGNASDCERGYQGSMQQFERGSMLQTDSGAIYVFYDDGTWEWLSISAPNGPPIVG